MRSIPKIHLSIFQKNFQLLKRQNALEKDKFSLEGFDEKISHPIQELFSDQLGMEIGELYDIEHEEDEDLLGFFTFSFSSEKQFRWDESATHNLPLPSSNLMVPFTMKGGFFSQLALIILQKENNGITEVSIYSKD